MKNIKGIILIGLITFQLGCSHYLDVEPKGEVVPNTVNELGELLIGKYKYSYSKRSTTFMSDELIVSESTYSSLFPIHKNGYLWQPIYDVGDEDLDWKDCYENIYTTNYVLSLIDDVDSQGSNEIDRNRVKAEALTIRSYEYFQLVNIYGEHYNEETSSTDLAVPLLLIDDLSASLPRSSVEDIYSQIVNDLLFAIDKFTSDLIPNVRSNTSKTGAMGLLSRVYLYQGEWEKSLEYAQLTLDNYNFLYNYNDYTVSDADKTKSIDRTLHLESVLFRSSTSSYCRDKEVMITNELRNIFDANDLRYTFFIKQNVDGNYIYEPNNPANIFPLSGITTPELILIQAECNARLGNVVEAMDNLHTLRINRFDITAYVDQATFETAIRLTAANTEEAIQKVLLERRKELMFTGLRWFDMKRLVVDDRYTHTTNRTMNGETYSLVPGDGNWVVDISPDIKNLNPNIN